MGKTTPATNPTPSAEAEPEPAASPATVTVEWNDQKWVVPASADDWDVDAAIALESGRALTFLSMVLGDAQMTAFRRGTRRKAADAAELFDLVVRATGGRSAGE